MLPTRVPEVIRSLARWAVLSSIGVTPACAAHSEDGQWEPIGCIGQSFPKLLGRVELDGRFDYVGIYRQFRGSGVALPGAPAGGVRVLTKTREPCTEAIDGPACTAAVDAQLMPSAQCLDGGDCKPFLLTTAVDEVRRSDDRAALLDLLGAIDDRGKAVLVAMFDGYATACPQTKDEGTAALRGTETRPSETGFELRNEWEECGSGLFRQILDVDSEGNIIELEKKRLAMSGCTPGRRPAGLCVLPAAVSRDTLGAFLAQATRLEAASVYAFERLARELSVLGAPDELVMAALRSAREEVRHAQIMGTLARRWGGEPLVPIVAELPERAPALIALENAIEGCVRETYGALVAHHQAQRALDPELRAALSAIAEDETRHATLAWSIAHWLEPRLSPTVQRALAFARSAAVAQLFREVDPGLSLADARMIGWPAPDVAVAMIAQLASALQIA